MSLQETPVGCRESPFCSDPAWGFLHGVAQHHGFMQSQSATLGISNVHYAAPQKYANLYEQ